MSFRKVIWSSIMNTFEDLVFWLHHFKSAKTEIPQNDLELASLPLFCPVAHFSALELWNAEVIRTALTTKLA